MTTTNANNLTAKAILLVRVSTQIQSLDEQTNQLLLYAKSKGYLEENLIIIEDKESAIKLSEEERNGLNQMKEFIASDPSIDAVYVWELSRLFRQQKTGYSLREFFISNKIQLFCLSPNFQLLTNDRNEVDGSGSISFALFAEMADAEMRNKKARFKRTKIKNARTGKYSGGFRKFGYDIDKDGYYIINEVEAGLVRLIFDLYESGLSIKKVQNEINARGLTRYKFNVQNILRSTAYTGFSDVWGFDRVYPVIISKEQFEKCKEIATTNNSCSADKAKEIYYCNKLIKCSCGYHYIGIVTTTQYLCYASVKRDNIIDKCKEHSPININLLDSLVWHVVKEFEVALTTFQTAETIEKLQAEIDINQQKIDNYHNQIIKANNKNERNNDMYFAGSISIEKYNLNQKVVADEIKNFNNSIVNFKNINEKHQKQIDTYNADNDMSMFANKEDYLNSFNDLQKQELIKKHVQSISICNDVKNVSKIVVINFDNYNYQSYRIHIKTKPQTFEFDRNNIDKNATTQDWVKVEIPVVRRFERK